MKIIFYTFVVLHQIKQHALDILLLGTNTSEWWKVWVTMPQVSAPSLPNTLQYSTNTVSKYSTADKYTTNTVEQQTALSRSARLYLSEVLHCVSGRVPSISIASSCVQWCPQFAPWIVVGHMSSPLECYPYMLSIYGYIYMSSLECYPRTTLENLFHLSAIQYFVLFFFFRSPRI